MILEKTRNKLVLLSLWRTLYNAHCQQEFVFLFRFPLICIHKQVAVLNFKTDCFDKSLFCISLKLNWWRPQMKKRPLDILDNFPSQCPFYMQQKITLFFSFLFFDCLLVFCFVFLFCIIFFFGFFIFAWCKWTLVSLLYIVSFGWDTEKILSK